MEACPQGQARGELRAPPRKQGYQTAVNRSEGDMRSVRVPFHRFSPVKQKWTQIYTPIVEMCKLEIRMNLKTRSIDIRAGPNTTDDSALQKGEDFIRAVVIGFEINDALALIRLDDIYLDGFEVKDVKTLKGDNLSRCIGRMSGSHGKTKFSLENITRTRIVIADTHLHLMGQVQNIRIAKTALVDLIRGSPATKVISKSRRLMTRINEMV
uniref:Pre-rRNA-processing protein PNO1 n=1 Tax=Paramoeba aestuarina TaxID=180227 RepID=A0A7S4N3R7_9EUKA|mmetsp:Transcript_10225/g.15397  ORF Transcript_10225/g.15397 Transcript_10225/m.15397 type:complete len:211 (+) Transcript_10225:20-652(+)